MAVASNSYIIGIDEVGRGALAGPVVVAAVLLPARGGAAIIKAAKLGILKDSKKLSAPRREAWAKYFRRHAEVDFAIARVYPRGIERMNISAAANRAAERAFERLIAKRAAATATATAAAAVKTNANIKVSIFLDGGLFLGSRANQLEQHKKAKTVIKGDEKIAAVAAASIIAKVVRDHFMVKLAARYPRYHFDIHKGYGTALHRAALSKFGPCEAHRLTFLRKKPIIKR
jgi:ribonuclease HII